MQATTELRPWAARARRPWAALAWGLALILAMQPGGPLIQLGWFAYLGWLLPAIGFCLWRHRKRDDAPRRPPLPLWSAYILLALCVVYLFTNAAASHEFYFVSWAPVGEYAFRNARLSRFMAATAFFVIWCAWRPPKPWLLILAILVYTQVEAARGFLHATGGQVIYGDDHPSFMMRMWTFARTFPHCICYSPYWNGGRATSYLLATGSIAPGLLLWPLWRLADIESVYNGAILGLFLLGLPAVAAGATRMVGGRAVAVVSAAVLSLGASLLFYKWLLHFGTLGASTALPTVMLIAACLFRIVWLGQREWWCGALLVAASSLFLCWPPSALFVPAFLVALLVSVRQIDGRTLRFLLACGAAVFALYLPYAIGLTGHSQAAQYLAATGQAPEWKGALEAGWRELAVRLVTGHPVILFLGLLGAWFLPERGLRVFFGTLTLALAVITGWGGLWKPEWGLERAAMPLLFVGVIPAASWLGHLFEEAPGRSAFLRGTAFALLLAGAMNTVMVWGNSGRAPYRTRTPYMADIIHWIKDNTPQDARMLFAGAAVHAYGGGHVAYLPVETGREMMASDYYHFSPKLVEYEYPPRPYRASREGLMEYMELFNVSHIITYHAAWVRVLRKYPEDYEEVASFGQARKYVIFKVARAPNWFVEGQGEVHAGLNRIRVHLRDANMRAVIKYRWADGFAATPPAVVEPYDAGNDIRLIAIRPNGLADVQINYATWL